MILMRNFRKCTTLLMRRGIISRKRLLSSSASASASIEPTVTNEHNLKYNRETGAITQMLQNEEKIVARTIIGLEIHTQLTNTPTKLFSHSHKKDSNSKAATAANTSLSYFDIAYPGMLPNIFSPEIIHDALVTSLAFNCTIHPISRFERKHYMYKDLPHGYQITQQRWPFASNGIFYTNSERSVEIERIQLEMDSGKTSEVFGLDYNRAGVPLLEIVFLPSLHSATDVGDTIYSLRRMLRRLGVCRGFMQQGHLRVDVNVNVELLAMNQRSQRVEVKNVNSVRHVIQAIEYEGVRQTNELLSTSLSSSSQSAKKLKQTRTFDSMLKKTILLRSKEDDIDYRFMPEPNLPPLNLHKIFETDKTSLSQLMHSLQATVIQDANEIQLLQTFQNSFHLSKDIVHTLVTSDFIHATTLFQSTLDYLVKQKSSSYSSIQLDKCEISSLVANWIVNDYFKLLKIAQEEEEEAIEEVKEINFIYFAELLLLLLTKQVTVLNAKRILSSVYSLERHPVDIAKEMGVLVQSNTQDNLETIIHDIVFDDLYEKQRMQFKRGGKHENKIMKFFIGKIMQLTKGVHEPDSVKSILTDILKKL